MAAHTSSTNDNIHAPAEQKHVTPVTIATDFVLISVFFYFMFGWVKNHVASSDPKFILFFGASTAICVTGVFWMAIQMFRVVLAGEKRLKAERAAK
jgi:F0F1-type ATP synthase assembly protein I